MTTPLSDDQLDSMLRDGWTPQQVRDLIASYRELRAGAGAEAAALPGKWTDADQAAAADALRGHWPDFADSDEERDEDIYNVAGAVLRAVTYRITGPFVTEQTLHETIANVLVCFEGRLLEGGYPRTRLVEAHHLRGELRELIADLRARMLPPGYCG